MYKKYYFVKWCVDVLMLCVVDVVDSALVVVCCLCVVVYGVAFCVLFFCDVGVECVEDFCA